LRVPVEQGFGRDDHPGYAEAALDHILINESLLHGVKVLGSSEPFERRDLTPTDVLNRKLARVNCPPIDQHLACPALTQATTQLGALQAQIVAEHIDQGRLRLYPDVVLTTIDPEGENPRHTRPPCRPKRPLSFLQSTKVWLYQSKIPRSHSGR